MTLRLLCTSLVALCAIGAGSSDDADETGLSGGSQSTGGTSSGTGGLSATGGSSTGGSTTGGSSTGGGSTGGSSAGGTGGGTSTGGSSGTGGSTAGTGGGSSATVGCRSARCARTTRIAARRKVRRSAARASARWLRIVPQERRIYPAKPRATAVSTAAARSAAKCLQAGTRCAFARSNRVVAARSFLEPCVAICHVREIIR